MFFDRIDAINNGGRNTLINNLTILMNFHHYLLDYTIIGTK